MELKKLSNKIISELAVWFNSFLATDYSRKFENWFGSLTESSASIYDKAVDHVYNTSHEGGWLHRLFDGSHDPISMWNIVKEARIDDTKKEEIAAFLNTFIKDFNTHAGLPLFTISKDSYDKYATYLSDTFHIPKNWFADIQTLNGSELLGSSIGVLALIFNWNNEDKERFGDLMSTMLISGVVSANPLTLILSTIYMGRHFHKQKKKKLFSQETLLGIKKGTITSVVFIGVSTMIGGTAWVGIILGLILAVIARKNHKKISIKSIYNWFNKQISMLFKLKKNYNKQWSV